MARLAFLALLVFPAFALAKLEIKNVQPSHGLLGPARESDDVFPLDEYFVRYQVTGIKPDKDGKASLETTVRLTNADGKVVYDPEPKGRRVDLYQGGNLVQASGFITFSDKVPPGEYKLTVTVRDLTANDSASFDRKLTCKPPTFQILMPRFARDADGKVPAGTTGLVGDALHYSLKVVGYDKSQKKVALVMRATIVDNDGKDVGAKPLEVKGDITDPAKAADSKHATFNGMVSLHRAGDFKLRIVVEDTLGKKTATFETPLKVLAP
jgi:hypothetical protein